MKKARILTQKALAVLAALALLLGAAPLGALAAGTNSADETAPPAVPVCSHVHDDACGYDESADEATAGETTTQAPAAPCAHRHSEDCGAPQTQAPPEEPPAAPAQVLGFDAPTGAKTVPLGTGQDALALPTALAAQVAGADGAPTPAEVPVTWAAEGYDAATPGSYAFAAVLGQGFALAPGVPAPGFVVTVQATPATPAAPQRAARAADMVVDITTLTEPQIVDRIGLALYDAGTSGATVRVVSDTEVTATSTITIAPTSGLFSGTLLWEADISGEPIGPVISCGPGFAGTFVVASGGAITNNRPGDVNDSAIKLENTTSRLMVNGGTVQAVTGNAIKTAGHVELREDTGTTMVAKGDGGEVEAIELTGADSTFTMAGGTVANGSTDLFSYAVYLHGTPSSPDLVNAVVSGGSILAPYGRGVNSKGGNMAVSGGAISTHNYALISGKTGGTVSITGGTLQTTATGSGHATVNALQGSVTISGASAKIIAVGNDAVYTGRNIVMNDGEVTSKGAGLNALGDITIKGGTVETSGTAAIGKDVIIEGGTIQATGSGVAAVLATKDVDISQRRSHTTLVGSASGSAVVASGATSTITVTSGTVQSAGASHPTLLISNPANNGSSSSDRNIHIAGGTVQNTAAGGTAVETPGNMRVSGGTVRATGDGGTAITAGNNVLVGQTNSGPTLISATSGTAIQALAGMVDVMGGTVQATTGTAIDGGGYVTVRNATVQATGDGGVAIKAATTPTINQTAGATTLVSATTGAAIISDSPITVGGGTVCATTGSAIVASRNGPQTVAVRGGVVMNQSAAQPAIKFDYPSTGITQVTGGLVFSWGAGAQSIVNLPGFAPTGSAVAAAWNTTTGTGTYTALTGTQLFMQPAGSTYWANNAQGQGGLAYENGTNTGFLPLAGVTVQKATLTQANFTHTLADSPYSGAPYSFTLAAVAPLRADMLGGHEVYFTGINGTAYPKTTSAPTNAGSYAVTIDAPGGPNVNAASGLLLKNITITKLPLTLVGVAATNRTYDGTTGVELTGGALTGAAAPDQNDPARLAFAMGGGSVASPAPGTGKDVALDEPAIVTGSAAGNYSFAQPTGITVDIAKATTTGVPQSLYVMENRAFTYGFDLETLLPSPAPPAQLGSVAYSVQGTSGDGPGVFAATPATADIDAGTLPLQVKNTEAGKTATVNIKVASANYEDFTVALTVTVVDKIPLTPSFTLNSGPYSASAYAATGVAFAKTDGSGSVALAENDYTITYAGTGATTYGPSATPPQNAGSYTATVAVQSVNPTYAGTATKAFTIGRRPITLRANRVDISTGQTVPALTYSVENLAPGETGADAIATAPTLAHNAPHTNTPGVYAIALSGGTATANYAISARQNGMLTVSDYHYINSSGQPVASLPKHTSPAAEYSVRLNAPYSTFFNGTQVIGAVLVNGNLLTPDVHYTHAEGSTVITLKASYLQTLPNGVHTLTVRFADGAASLPFTVEVPAPPHGGDGGDSGAQTGPSPQTGDGSNAGLWAVLAGLSASGAGGGALFVRRRRRPGFARKA